MWKLCYNDLVKLIQTQTLGFFFFLYIKFGLFHSLVKICASYFRDIPRTCVGYGELVSAQFLLQKDHQSKAFTTIFVQITNTIQESCHTCLKHLGFSDHSSFHLHFTGLHLRHGLQDSLLVSMSGRTPALLLHHTVHLISTYPTHHSLKLYLEPIALA